MFPLLWVLFFWSVAVSVLAVSVVAVYVDVVVVAADLYHRVMNLHI